MQPHPLYSRDASVIIEEGFEKLELLDRAIERSQFLENVEAVFRASNKPREQFLIAIKPNLMTASIPENPSPVYTNPDLVEHLIGRLLDRGFTDIALVEARNVYDYSYQGRSVQAVAEMVGYSCQGYRVEDLSEQKEPFDYGGVLGRHYVGRSWRDADYRISAPASCSDLGSDVFLGDAFCKVLTIRRPAEVVPTLCPITTSRAETLCP